MSGWARTFAACSLLPAISLLAASCGSRAGEPEPPKKERPARRVSSGEVSEEVIRATLRALTAEKLKAKEHHEQGNRYFARWEFKKALSEFRKALDMFPRDPKYKSAVAKAEFALGMR